MTTPAPASSGGAPAAPAAPSNGAASKTTTPIDAPKPNSPGAPPPGASAADDDPEIDLGDTKIKRSAAKREFERGRNASRLLNEAEKRNRAAEEREKAWAERKQKKDLAGLIEELGLTPDEERQFLSERMYSRHIAPEQMTPEQRELAEHKAWRADREAKDKKAAEDAAAQKKAAINKQQGDKLHKDIIAAAEAGKIPKSPRAIRRIMEKAVSFDSRGMELPLEQLAALVREDVAEDVGELTDATSIAERKELLGPKRFKAEQDKWLAHFKAMQKAPPVPQATRAPPQRSANGTFKRDTYTPQEFLARLNARK